MDSNISLILQYNKILRYWNRVQVHKNETNQPNNIALLILIHYFRYFHSWQVSSGFCFHISQHGFCFEFWFPYWGLTKPHLNPTALSLGLSRNVTKQNPRSRDFQLLLVGENLPAPAPSCAAPWRQCSPVYISGWHARPLAHSQRNHRQEQRRKRHKSVAGDGHERKHDGFFLHYGKASFTEINDCCW